MPKITSVEPQKKSARRRTKRFNVFLDGQFAFGADEDLVVEQRLVVGKVFALSDLEKLLFESEVGKLMERMYGLFNVRQRSEKEVRDYLRNLSFKRKIKDKEEISEVAIESLIKKLKNKGLLNDAEFARAWVESRSKKKGLISIKNELFKKGVNREIIEEVLTSQLPTGQEKVAEHLLTKRWPRLKNLPPLEKKKKAHEFLLRRGFSYDLVKEVVEKLLKKEYTTL